jgi:protein-tyrosine phosphatase
MTDDSRLPLGDLHSHLVPGVDDGARTLEEALDAVGAMVEVGIGTIVTTPHIRASLFHDPERAEGRISEVEAAYRRLAVAVEERFPDVRLGRGFEVMLDVPDPDLRDPRVRMASTDFVLVEWPRMRIPRGTSAVLSRIRSEGWIPVIAHPERYHGLDAELRIPLAWRQSGALLQVNHGSLVGRYGNEARLRALRLLEAGAVQYLSTDHHPRPGHGLEVRAVERLFSEAGADETFECLTRVNPDRLVNGEPPVPVPGFVPRRGFMGRLGNLLGGRN